MRINFAYLEAVTFINTKIKLFFILTFCITGNNLFAGSINKADTIPVTKTLVTVSDTVKKITDISQRTTIITGQVVDAESGKPLSNIAVTLIGTTYGVATDSLGKFSLSAPGIFSKVSFSYVGYQSQTKTAALGKENKLIIKLHRMRTTLHEVAISSKKIAKYKNKGNPAVELIQQVINHKDQNRAQSADYTQYNMYERMAISLVNIPTSLIDNAIFRKYKFMLDTVKEDDGQKQVSLPAYFNEKLSENYYRRDPEKTIKIINAEKGINIIKFIDTAGVDTYINRLYGDNIDIYENNVFVLTSQFLSPISNHSYDYYKFFIDDTIKIDSSKFIKLSFTPRVKGGLLFEGSLLVSMDGAYAVKSCTLNVNKNINVNFLKQLSVTLDFQKYPDSRYYVSRSEVKADFGLLKNKGIGALGTRTVVFSDYKLHMSKPADFYNGNSLQTAENYNKVDSQFWTQNRTDTLSKQQQKDYSHVQQLEGMQSYKRLSWVATFLATGYADLHTVQVGPVGSFLSYDNPEGLRFQVGGRTTPYFSKFLYLQGYAAYGTKDDKLKYSLNTYFSFNNIPYHRYPNNYLKIGYKYDTGLPGQNFIVNNAKALIGSFQTGRSDFFLLNKIFTTDYVKEFQNHFSFDIGVKNWTQQAYGNLIFQSNNPGNALIDHLTTTEIGLGLRYAPHEKLILGYERRHTIYSKYPIINVQINHGFKGVLNSSYNYTNMGVNVMKRLYMSQLGFGDITILGSYLTGKVPFPLLNISQANQSLAYDPDGYNKMTYLEFVSDHYAGINYTQSFQGFFLNRIPLIKHLKWREYLSLKILKGGLRDENNPLLSPNLYKFPIGSSTSNGTYALGNTPYTEAGVGVGNIFKLLRFDVIRRFTYLDHAGVSPYGVKFSVVVDL